MAPSGEAPAREAKRGEAMRLSTPPVFLADARDMASDVIILSGAEGRHAATVRRIAVGERVDVADGAGGIAECVVTGVQRGRLELAVKARRTVPGQEPVIVVVQAIPKGERGPLAVELMTEVGVDAVVAWAAERCVARWQGERGERALARWRAAAREAAKQSRRAWLPEVTGPVTLGDVTRMAGAASLSVLLDPGGAEALGRLALPSSGDIVVVVGPEGGVSPAEASALDSCGAVRAHLGPTVLRTSSAGAVAASVLLSRSARWGAAPGR
jgi:16S rRNA (uracil1498-N3)-methyltransferase